MQGPWRNVYAGLARNRDGAGFARMVKLTMAASRPHEIPAVSFNKLQEFPTFIGNHNAHG